MGCYAEWGHGDVKLQASAISSTESKFYAISQYVLDCVYLRTVLSMMGYQQTQPTSIAQDNTACIYLVRGSGMYNRAKHIDMRVYRVRELASGKTPEVAVRMNAMQRVGAQLLRHCARGLHDCSIF